MVASKPQSRAASVLSNANARNMLKRRSKPYRLEQQKVMAKKRKLDIKTSYQRTSPYGYTFLAVGTPDMAELCKELSRIRNLPVNVVNATPKSAQALDPDKISHHIHRIGYHFRSEVVEEARQALGYIHHRGRFITKEDLQKEQRDSFMATLFVKHRLPLSNQVTDNEETPEQVRAAIKELFPKIPDKDLDEVVSHAWAKGEARVGNAKDMSLARRVQLAVTARIRHKYTDYDALLGAFGDWKAVRSEVEPALLQKLVEWRGESGSDNDGLEEIVRETIVIDDDEDEEDPDTGGGGDSSGDISDGSVEIIHRPAGVEDLRAENAAELAHYQRYDPHRRAEAKRADAARKMIHDARRQVYNPTAAVTRAQVQPYNHPRAVSGNVQQVFIPPQSARGPIRRVVHNGQVFQLGNDLPPPHPNVGDPYVPQDRPVQSIERDDDPRQILPAPSSRVPSAYRSRPTTPQGRLADRLRQPYVDLTQDSPTHAKPFDGGAPYQGGRWQPAPRGYLDREVVDLTSPYRQRVDQPVPQPQVIHVVSSGDGRYVPAPVYQSPRGEPAGHPRYEPPAYPDRHHPNHAAPEVAYAFDQSGVRQSGPAPVADFNGAIHPTQMFYPRSAPAPIHGAPAPVQQMPREPAYPMQAPYMPLHGAAETQPYHGYPAVPVQQYYPR